MKEKPIYCPLCSGRLKVIHLRDRKWHQCAWDCGYVRWVFPVDEPEHISWQQRAVDEAIAEDEANENA